MKTDIILKEHIILHERILGLLLFHLSVMLSCIVYMMGKDTLVDITVKMIETTNMTIEYRPIHGNDHWIYGDLVIALNSIVTLFVNMVQHIQHICMSSLEMLLMSFEYGILATTCMCMMAGTMLTFCCMKLYRSEIEVGLFGIKIRN